MSEPPSSKPPVNPEKLQAELAAHTLLLRALIARLWERGALNAEDVSWIKNEALSVPAYLEDKLSSPFQVATERTKAGIEALFAPLQGAMDRELGKK